MAYVPYPHLEATPDFATFQFHSPILPEPVVRQVRFNNHQGGQIYHVEFRNGDPDKVEPNKRESTKREPGKKDDPNWPESKDFFCTVLTTLQIIEIYLERYPRRVLRFSGNSPVKALIFGTILARFHHLLVPLFEIEMETPAPKPVFLIRRKSIPWFSLNTVESTWNGTSRIFRDQFSVKMDKRIRIGVTLPSI